MLRFVLSRPAIVEFVVIRVAPDCRQVGRFRVAGRAGVNRVRFSGRLRGRLLAPGAYRIRARTFPQGRALAEARLVIFNRTPHRAELAAARSSNTCRASDPGTGTSSTNAGAGSARGPSSGGDDAEAVSRAGGAQRPHGRGVPAGVLGAQFSRAAYAVQQIHPFLYVLLGMAIALLAVAALPVQLAPSTRVAALLAYRRGTVALTGAAALVAVSIAYALA